MATGICGRCDATFEAEVIKTPSRCEECVGKPLTQRERSIDAWKNSKIALAGDMHIWSDVCKRRCTCKGCGEFIRKGDRRIVFDSRRRGGGTALKGGGMVTRYREFVHLDCLVKALEIECTACLDREFAEFRDSLLEEVEA